MKLTTTARLWKGAACFRLVAAVGDHDLHQQHLITNTAEEFS